MILNGRHIGLALVAAILKIERGSDQILIKHTLKNTYANFHAFMKFCTPKFARSLAIYFAIWDTFPFCVDLLFRCGADPGWGGGLVGIKR